MSEEIKIKLRAFVDELVDQGLSEEEIRQKVEAKKQELLSLEKTKGVADQAAAVAPEKVAAATGLASETSLSESQRLAAPLVEPKSNINNLLEQVYDNDKLSLAEQAKFLYNQKFDAEFQYDPIFQKKIQTKGKIEPLVDQEYDKAYANFEKNKEKTKAISQQYLKETGVDPFAPSLAITSAQSYARTALNQAKLNFDANLDMEDTSTVTTLRNNSLQTLMDSDKYLQNYLIPNIFESIVTPQLEIEQKRIEEKYGFNNPRYLTQASINEANAEYNEIANKLINDALNMNPEFISRVNTIQSGLDEELKKDLTEQKRKELGLDEISGTKESFRKSMLSINNSFNETVRALNDINYQNNKAKINQIEERLESGELKLTDKRIVGGSISAREGTRIGGEEMTIEEELEKLKSEQQRYIAENALLFEKFKAREYDLSFFKDYNKDIDEAQNLSEFVGAFLKNTGPIVAEQAPQLVLALSGIGVFAQELGPTYYEGIRAKMEKDGVEMTDENFLKYVEQGAGDANLTIGTATLNQFLESYGAGTIAKQIFKNMGPKSINSLFKLGAKEWVKRGGVKQLGTGAAKGGFTESLTETFQTAASQISKGLSVGNAFEYLDTEEMVRAAQIGGYMGFLLPFGGNIAKQSVTDIQGAASRIQALGDPNATLRILDSMKKDIQLNIKNEVITKEEGEQKLKSINDIANSNLKIPKYIQGEERVKVLNLIAEKNTLEESIKDIDSAFDTSETENRILNINKEISDIAQIGITKTTEQTAKSIAEEEGIGFFNESEQKIKELIQERKNKGENIDVQKSKDFGFIVQNSETGQQDIYINKDATKEFKTIKTAAHEMLHAVLKKTFTSAEIQTKLGSELQNEIIKMNLVGTEADSEFAKRWNLYKQNAAAAKKDPRKIGNAWEEGLTLLSEGLLNGSIQYNETTFTKIGDFIRRALSSLGIKAKFDSGKDVLNFVRDYNKSLLAGKLTAGQKRILREGGTGALIDFAQSETGIQELGLNIKESKAKDEFVAGKNIDTFFETSTAPDKNFQTVELFRPIVTKIVNAKYKNVPGFNSYKDLIIDESLTGQGGVIDIINNFDPNKGKTLTGNVNQIVGKDNTGRSVSLLERRITGVGNKILPEQFTQDITEIQEKVEAPVVSQKPITKEEKSPTTRNVIDRLNLSPAAKQKSNEATNTILGTLLPQIQTKKGFNFRNEFKKGVRTLLYNDIREELGGSDSKSYLMYVNNNLKAIHEIIPLSVMVKRLPQYVEQVVDENGKPIRSQVSYTGKQSYAGNFVYKKKPFNEIKEEFKKDFTEGRNALETRRKLLIETIAEEAAYDEVQQVLNDPNIKSKLEFTQEQDINEEFEEELLRNAQRGPFTKYSLRLDEVMKNNKELESEIGQLFVKAWQERNKFGSVGAAMKEVVKGINLTNLTIEDVDVISKELDQSELNKTYNDDQIGVAFQNVFGFNTEGRKFRLGANPQKNNNTFLTEEKNINLNLLTKHYKDSELAKSLAHNVFNNKDGLNRIINTTASGAAAQRKVLSDNNIYTYEQSDMIPINSDINKTDKIKKQIPAKKYIAEGIDKVAGVVDLNIENGIKRQAAIEKEMFKVDLNYRNQLKDLKEGSQEKIELQKEFLAHREFMGYILNSIYIGPGGFHTRSHARGMTYTIGAAIYELNGEYYFEHIPASSIRHANQLKVYEQALNATTEKQIDNIIDKAAKENNKNSVGLWLDNRWQKIFQASGNKKIEGSIYDNINKTTVDKAKSIMTKAELEWLGDRTYIELRQELAAKINSTPGAQERIQDLKNKGVDVSAIDFEAFSKSQANFDNTINNNIEVKNSLRSKDISEMLDGLDGRKGERAREIKSGKNSEVRAKKLAAKAGLNFKNRWNIWLNHEAEDFYGLVQKLARSGRAGEKDIELIKEQLIDPYVMGIMNLESERQLISNTFENAKKGLKGINSKLKLKSFIKKDGLNIFTNEDAIRVYLYNDAGHSIPELNDADKKKLISYVKKEPGLKEFAENLKTGFGDNKYPTPEANWQAGGIATDVTNNLNKTSRIKFLTPWIKNIEKMLTPKNKNKMIAAFGTDFVENLETSIIRAKSGKNRIQPKTVFDRNAQATIDYINNSVGAIMFFNMRSGLLQTISFTNYINYTDNNIINYGKAASNLPQLAKDIAYLWNTDFLNNRRGGAAWNIQEAEILEALEKGGNKSANVVNFLNTKLKKALAAGFIPTRIADSAAIVLGGAPFYRNRVNSYLKQGMSLEAAEKKALTDWKKLTNVSQQSSDPLRVSNVQAGPLGRFVFAFNNVLFQYNRLAKRDLVDIAKGRRIQKEDGTYMSLTKSAMVRLSRISYYMTVQNIVFQGLQSGLFMLMFSDEDEATPAQKEKRDKLIERQIGQAANGMADSILRGSGYIGAIIAMIKNYRNKVKEELEEENAFLRDLEATTLETATLSPPVDHKLRKLNNLNKYLLGKNYYETFLPPSIEAGAEALNLLNIPADRLIRKAENLYNAATLEATTMERIMLGAGWSAWNLGLEGKKLFDKNGNFKGFDGQIDDGGASKPSSIPSVAPSSPSKNLPKPSKN